MSNRSKQSDLVVTFRSWLQGHWLRRLILGLIALILLILSPFAPVDAHSNATALRQISPLPTLIAPASTTNPNAQLNQLGTDLTKALVSALANTLANVLSAALTSSPMLTETAAVTTPVTETMTVTVPLTSSILSTVTLNNAFVSPLAAVTQPVTVTTINTSVNPLAAVTQPITDSVPATVTTNTSTTNDAFVSPLASDARPLTSSVPATMPISDAPVSPLLVLTETVPNSVPNPPRTDNALPSPLVTLTATMTNSDTTPVTNPADVVVATPDLLALATSYVNRGQTSLVLVVAVIFGILMVIGQLLWRQR